MSAAADPHADGTLAHPLLTPAHLTPHVRARAYVSSHSQRLLTGSVDGSSGHETVGGALRALLSAARAQLDRQVEVRMRQAAGRSSVTKSTSAGGAERALRADKDLSPGPVERRVRLDFHD